MGKSFQGSIVLGKGFILLQEEALALINKDPRNKQVLFPYLNGDDLNNSPNQEPSRWVINFFDWAEEKARTYPDCFDIVERLVRPERFIQKDKGGKEKWWQFLRPRKELYATISELDQVMILNRHAKHLLISIIKNNIVFSEATVVLAINKFSEFAILNSSIHDIWAWKNSSTMGAATLRYSASRAFETFPFPTEYLSNKLEDSGLRLFTIRKELMSKYKIGLTELQNIYHNKDLKSSSPYFHDIIIIRQLQQEIDYLIIEAYNWGNMQLQHDFYPLEHLPESDRIRFFIHPDACREILKRLLLLNDQYYNQEISSALKPEIQSKKVIKKIAKDDSPKLF
ncbi:hypothetical protein LRS05_09305 [Flavobacterium sp. J372]|uniref:type IIL restriction-modification enzyme MmeI n=1 Tax=Flavobacterium sp. J372 TaxID=2898436 RepID=UPI00215166BC|nr:type IIL restriction-modification enzyme MmeI [Flavobacterium sp. J372]MCR5862329.1 hypothetical protein [Flavobacterium sp. J372]